MTKPELEKIVRDYLAAREAYTKATAPSGYIEKRDAYRDALNQLRAAVGAT